MASSGAITSANLIPYRESISFKIVGPYGTLMKFLGVCHQNMWEARLDTCNGEPMVQLTIETDLAQGALDKILLFSELTRID